MRNVVLQLGLRALERARELGDRIRVSVQKSADITKETRKEIVAAVRERTAAAKLLARRGTGQSAVVAGAEPQIDLARAGRQAIGQANRVGGVVRGVFGGGSVSATSIAELFPEVALAALAAKVFDLALKDIQKAAQAEVAAIADKLKLDLDARLRTFDQRIERDRVSRALAEGRAGDELFRLRQSQEAALLGYPREAIEAVIMPEDH